MKQFTFIILNIVINLTIKGFSFRKNVLFLEKKKPNIMYD